MLNVVQHASQHLQEVLSGRTAKTKSLHKITTAVVNHHQVGNTILGNLEAIKIHVRRTRSPEICRAKVINFWLIKAGEKGCSIIRKVWNGDRTAAYLKQRRGSGKWTY